MCFSRNFCAMFAKTAFASISKRRDRKWSVSDRAARLIKTHRPSMQGGIYAQGIESASKKCYFFVFLSEQTTRACVSAVVTKSEMSKLLATLDGVKSLRSEISSSEHPRRRRVLRATRSTTVSFCAFAILRAPFLRLRSCAF